MAESLNQSVTDGVVTRAVQLQRLSAGETRKVMALLQKLEKDLLAELFDVNPTGATRTAFKQQRLERLLKQVQAITREHYTGIHREFMADLKEIAALESAFSLSVINAPIGIELASVALTPERLRAIASDVLIAGSPLKTWWGRQSVDLQNRFADTIRQGMLRGESLQDLLNRVRGTKARGYTDGVLQASRRSAETLILSATAAVSNEAYEQTWIENQDVVSSLIWTATLEVGRKKGKGTCLLCAVRDGKRYAVQQPHKPIGHSIPWNSGPGRIHPRCRCVSRSELKGFSQMVRSDALTTGGRRTGITNYVRSRLEAQGLKGPDLNKAFSTIRASLDGPVSGETTFFDYLAKRSPAAQDLLLGKAKGALFRAGRIGDTDLLDFRGRPLTLAELQ